jgi:oligoribonuclease NrnB/cAMP/cGMP phosphodiesterase (DHH superfamily)
MKNICYYHKADLDGKCSAAIVRRKYPECELIGVDYPDRPDFEKIESGDTVFVVDYSFEPNDMYELGCQSYELVWIDHHKSAIEKISYSTLPDGVTSLGSVIKGKCEIGKAGCELTWEYLFPDEPIPDAVRLLGRYDVWDKNHPHWESIILPFQHGMRLNYWEPFSSQWQTLFENSSVVDSIKENGECIVEYESQRNQTYAKSMIFQVEFEGHDAWAINKALSNSKIFETIENSDERPLWILFNYKAGIWKYSLYSAPDSGIDVSKIAGKHGGGGHANAAGFQSDEYLLKNIEFFQKAQ